MSETTGYNRDKAATLWTRGSDYCVKKIGKKWALMDCFGNFPLFPTKKAACKAADAFVLLASIE